MPENKATISAVNTTTRRRFLCGSCAALGALAATSAWSSAAPKVAKHARVLEFAHLHTHEYLSLIYAVDGKKIAPAHQRLEHFLRDHYTDEVGALDPKLFDLLYLLRLTLDTREPFQVISGYRSAKTNNRLRNKSRRSGVAKKSLHTLGQAIDIRLSGVSLTDLRDAAWSLQAGGVGYYPRSDFVHVDTGAIRRW